MSPLLYDDLVRQMHSERIQQALDRHPEWAAVRVPQPPRAPWGRAVRACLAQTFRGWATRLDAQEAEMALG